MLSTLPFHGVKYLPRCSHCAVRERRLLLQSRRCRPASVYRRNYLQTTDRQRINEREINLGGRPPRHRDNQAYRPRQWSHDTEKQNTTGQNAYQLNRYSRTPRSHNEASRTSRRDDRQRPLQEDAGVSIRKVSKRPETSRGHWSQGDTFPTALRRFLEQVRQEEQDGNLIKSVAQERGESIKHTFKQLWSRFASTLQHTEDQDTVAWSPRPDAQLDQATVLQDLRRIHKEGGQTLLRLRIKYAFYDSILNPTFNSTIRRNQMSLANLRYPGEWFPETRQDARQFHLHVGPTNSGKTYQALKRLEQVKSTGVYAGPLRLLAHEVYSRINAKGLPCYLVTGEERRLPVAGSPANQDLQQSIVSCTVEMVPLHIKAEVAVIDEIQMISDPWRGWAWTQAVLGVRAKEVHLCGEERAVPLIQQICASLGEELIVHRYERLSPLQPDKTSIKSNFKNLRKGDCIVSFSVMGIHALKKQIEEKTGRKVAVVYGGLPAETRSQQAQLFNDPDNDYDFLVASDAIGMGLNLAIRRVIFETTAKHDGTGYRLLEVAQIKQIAGRAGRYRTALQATTPDQPGRPAKPSKAQNVGLVTTLEDTDLPVVENALKATPPPLLQAGVVPPVAAFEQFASYFPPETPFTYLIQKMWQMSSSTSTYFICSLKDILWIADAIEPVRGLTMRERYAFCAVPAGGRTSPLMPKLLPVYARIIADQKGGEIADIKELPLEILDQEVPKDKKAYLRSLESLHQALVCYMWLSYRFAGVFTQRALAKHTTELTEAKIAQVLDSFSFSEKARQALAAARKAQLLKNQAEAEREVVDLAEAEVVDGVQEQRPSLSAESDSDDMGIDELEHAEDEERHHQDAHSLESSFQTISPEHVLTPDSAASFGHLDQPAEQRGLDGDDHKTDVEAFAAKEAQDPAQKAPNTLPSSFALWRKRQRPGESQASHEPEP